MVGRRPGGVVVNRLVLRTPKGLDPARLPPRTRSGPVRLLFVHGNILGFRNVGVALERATETRTDVDAVHLHLAAPLWLKAIGKSLPRLPGFDRGWDFHQDRHRVLWGHRIGRWFRGPLSLEHFDVVHMMTQVHAWALVGARASLGARAPAFAVNIDSTAPAEIRDFGWSPLARAPMARAERRMFADADLVVCRNAWAARSLATDFGLDDGKVHVALNSPVRNKRHRGDVPRGIGEMVRIAFVGNNWKRKGGDLVLAAQQALADRAELHVFGRYTQYDANARNVIWHGSVDRHALLEEYLPTMDIFVLPSRYDMLPWALLEAGMAGNALVAARTGGVVDAVIEDETGVLFEPGNGRDLLRALTGLVDDRERCRRLGMQARAHVFATFDPEVTYPALVDRLVLLADR